MKSTILFSLLLFCIVTVSNAQSLDKESFSKVKGNYEQIFDNLAKTDSLIVSELNKAKEQLSLWQKKVDQLNENHKDIRSKQDALNQLYNKLLSDNKEWSKADSTK